MFPDNFKFDDSNEGRRSDHKLSAKSALTTCTGGLAGEYPCRNIDLRAVLTPAELGSVGGKLSDIWGWSDPLSGREIALVARQGGTSFVDVSDPDAPIFLAFLPSHDGGSDAWRDVKVYQDHAFIVADGSANATHGLQVFDLGLLRDITPGSTVEETAHLSDFGAAHNIAINEDSGFAYVVGSDQCSGGLFMVDVSTPSAPSFSGCFSADGYTHDAQCVTYQGPDTPYFNREICINYNEDSITVVDVTDKDNPQQLSRQTYPNSQYTHQGWFLSENHTYLIMNDELDEQRTGVNTTSYLYDASVLSELSLTGTFVAETQAIDHNLYTRDGFVIQSNYRAGLRVLNGAQIAAGELTEVAYFDTIPCSDTPQFSGMWSTFVDFPSGNVVSSDIANGLFVLSPDWVAINSSEPPGGGAPAISPACDDGSVVTPTPTAPVNNVRSSGGGGSLPGLPLFLLLLLCASVWRSRR
jgi:choice-of-anchor B domain-containing protein